MLMACWTGGRLHAGARPRKGALHLAAAAAAVGDGKAKGCTRMLTRLSKSWRKQRWSVYFGSDPFRGQGASNEIRVWRSGENCAAAAANSNCTSNPPVAAGSVAAPCSIVVATSTVNLAQTSHQSPGLLLLLPLHSTWHTQGWGSHQQQQQQQQPRRQQAEAGGWVPPG